MSTKTGICLLIFRTSPDALIFIDVFSFLDLLENPYDVHNQIRFSVIFQSIESRLKNIIFKL